MLSLDILHDIYEILNHIFLIFIRHFRIQRQCDFILKHVIGIREILDVKAQLLIGIITGSGFDVNPKSLGYSTCTYVGLNLERGSMYKDVVKRLLTL